MGARRNLVYILGYKELAHYADQMLGITGSIPVCGPSISNTAAIQPVWKFKTDSANHHRGCWNRIRRLGNHLLKENILKYHFIFTHAHWDHLIGFPFFQAALLQRRGTSHAPLSVSEDIC